MNAVLNEMKKKAAQNNREDFNTIDLMNLLNNKDEDNRQVSI
jgi:hypothetical protein